MIFYLLGVGLCFWLLKEQLQFIPVTTLAICIVWPIFVIYCLVSMFLFEEDDDDS